MPHELTTAQRCQEICLDSAEYEHSYKERRNIANQLAEFLLSKNEINCIWNFNKPFSGKASIVNYINYLDANILKNLMEAGLDLNPIIHNGVACFTWMIGNAENNTVNFLLEMATHSQTPELRKIWINKTDSMIRYTEPSGCCYFFSSKPLITPVHQTALQLVIAKGYTNKDGFGRTLTPSNFQLAEKLLSLGANDMIDYAEPSKGNTALHIAYARRDFKAIELLIRFGASLNIDNLEGKKPVEMLKLSFKEAQKLLQFHTSPDCHPNTFYLERQEFQNEQNLIKIKNITNVECSETLEMPAGFTIHSI